MDHTRQEASNIGASVLEPVNFYSWNFSCLLCLSSAVIAEFVAGKYFSYSRITHILLIAVLSAIGQRLFNSHYSPIGFFIVTGV